MSNSGREPLGGPLQQASQQNEPLESAADSARTGSTGRAAAAGVGERPMTMRRAREPGLCALKTGSVVPAASDAGELVGSLMGVL